MLQVESSTGHDSRDVDGTVQCEEDWVDVPDHEDYPEVGCTISSTVNTKTNTFEESATIFSRPSDYRKTLCPCTEISVNDVVLMVLALGMRHSLTWVAQLGILKMIQTIFPKAKVPMTKHLLFQKIKRDTVDVKYHVFCPKCQIYLKPMTILKEKVKCSICSTDLLAEKAANYFCSMSVRDQLRDLFEGPHKLGREVLAFRANRKKKVQANIEDIFDGTVYQQQCKPGFLLSDPNNFSYNFFTDGVPMGHSGKSIWPIYLSINELPEKLRCKYIILGGLYIGPKEPNLNVFLEPFVKEANLLSSRGITWSNDGVNVVSRAVPMCAIADSPARCKLLNMQGHAAKWGCTFCYHKKKPTDTSSIRKYLIPIGNFPPDRTAESLALDLEKAEIQCTAPKKEDRHWRGVYGPSSLATLNHFHICKNVAVDYMHCFLLGVVRAHTNNLLSGNKAKFWNVDLRSKDFSINDVIAILDCRLLEIKPPKSITRPPQPLSCRGNWKASEWRSWLLFYCLVCLQGILKEEYLVHLAKLSVAFYILMQDSISPHELKEANDLLSSYQCDYQKYFGQDSMVYQVHLLQHICVGVKRFGPLWTHSAFPYEAQNRYTLKLVTSPFSVVKQVVRRYLVNKSFPDLCVFLKCSDIVVDFCEETLSRQLKTYVYNSACYLLGKGHIVNFSEDECVALKACANYGDEQYFKDCVCYKRVLVKGFRVYALGCSEESATRTVNSYVNVYGLGSAVTEKIVLTPDGKLFILVRQIIFEAGAIVVDMKYDEVQVQHVRKVQRFGDLNCIYPGQITAQCVLIANEGEKYVSNFPYGCYRD